MTRRWAIRRREPPLCPDPHTWRRGLWTKDGFAQDYENYMLVGTREFVTSEHRGWSEEGRANSEVVEVELRVVEPAAPEETGPCGRCEGRGSYAIKRHGLYETDAMTECYWCSGTGTETAPPEEPKYVFIPIEEPVPAPLNPTDTRFAALEERVARLEAAAKPSYTDNWTRVPVPKEPE